MANTTRTNKLSETRHQARSSNVSRPLIQRPTVPDADTIPAKNSPTLARIDRPGDGTAAVGLEPTARWLTDDTVEISSAKPRAGTESSTNGAATGHIAAMMSAMTHTCRVDLPIARNTRSTAPAATPVSAENTKVPHIHGAINGQGPARSRPPLLQP